jgi:hypothetical protein
MKPPDRPEASSTPERRVSVSAADHSGIHSSGPEPPVRAIHCWRKSRRGDVCVRAVCSGRDFTMGEDKGVHVAALHLETKPRSLPSLSARMARDAALQRCSNRAMPLATAGRSAIRSSQATTLGRLIIAGNLRSRPNFSQG